MKIKFILLLSLCLFIASCEGEPTDWNITGERVRITAKIEETKTRASNTTWDPGDAIGIYMKDVGSALSSTINRNNAKYVNENGSSVFTAANESHALYYPEDGSKVDFIGYYPYRENISGFKYPIDLTVQSDLSKIDFMYSDNATNLYEEFKSVPMIFSHQLCKLVLNINHSNSIDMSDISIIITNTGTNAEFDLNTGTLSSATKFGNIQLNANKNTGTVEAILMPEEDTSDQELWLIIGVDKEMVYKYSLSSNLPSNALVKSTLYTLNIDLFSREFKATPVGGINDWISGPIVDVILEQTQELPPIIKGSKKSPFTVPEAQINQGVKGVWVEGYIVGGFTGSKVGSFTLDPCTARTSSVAIANMQNVTNINELLPVELPAGKIRDALNIFDNPTNKGKKIIIRGSLEKYYSAQGLKSPVEFMFIEL